MFEIANFIVKAFGGLMCVAAVIMGAIGVISMVSGMSDGFHSGGGNTVRNSIFAILGAVMVFSVGAYIIANVDLSFLVL
jgi:hypothetical protein